MSLPRSNVDDKVRKDVYVLLYEQPEGFSVEGVFGSRESAWLAAQAFMREDEDHVRLFERVEGDKWRRGGWVLEIKEFEVQGTAKDGFVSDRVWLLIEKSWQGNSVGGVFADHDSAVSAAQKLVVLREYYSGANEGYQQISSDHWELLGHDALDIVEFKVDDEEEGTERALPTPRDYVRLAAEGIYYRKDGEESHYFDFLCKHDRARLEPLRFTCTRCKAPMEYLDDVWWTEALKTTIENHKEFFDLFSRDDGKLKRDLIQLNPVLISFLAEFHTMVLIKLDQARQALEDINTSTSRFLRIGGIHIDDVSRLQRDLTAFFVSLAGALDLAEGEIEIVRRPAGFKIKDCSYVNIALSLISVPADIERWLAKRTLNRFRNFLVHRSALRVLSLVTLGQYALKSTVDLLGDVKTVTFKVYSEPAHIEVHWNSKLLSVLIQRLRAANRIPLWEFRPDRTYSHYLVPPFLPIVILPDESELNKSPEEIETFQEEDVRDFCAMNYEMSRKLLGLVYAHLIEMWRENA